MPTARDNAYITELGASLYAGRAAPPPPPPPPPAVAALTLVAGATSATVGVAATGWRVDNTGSVPAQATVTVPGDVTTSFTPQTIAAGANVAFSLTALVAGARSIGLTSSTPGAVITGSPATFTGVSAPAPGPTPPPPPPAPAGQATGASVSDMVSVVPVATAVGASLWSGSKPWTCGLLFRRGACPAGRTPGAHNGSVQVDWLTTWDDGSLRFARASGVTTAAEVPILTRGVSATGANVAEPNVAATVAFTSVVDNLGAAVAGGSFTADIATARTAGAGTWGRTQARLVRSLLGPICSEFHYFVPTADAHLAVWFYVRAYSSGDVEVETVVENGWLLVAAPGQRTYNVTVSVGGSDRYTGIGIAHLHHTRWTRTDWAGTDPASTMVQSPASLRTGGLIPAIGVESLDAAAYTTMPQTGTKHSAWTRALADRPVPFDIANIDPALGSGGDTDMYGLIPEWGATWLTEGHVGAYWSVIANARALGRYGLHYREEDDGRPVRGTSRTTLVLNDTGAAMSPQYSGGTQTPAPTGTAPPAWTYSHSPAAAFMGALLTARWSMLEQTQFQAATGDLCFNSNFKGGARIIEWYDQNRAIGWMVRDRAHAEALTPSILNGSVLTTGADFNQRQETVLRIEAQMAEWQDMYVAGSGTGRQYSARANGMGAPYQAADFDLYGSTVDGVHGYGGLQNNIYVACALYLYNCRPVIGSTAQTRMQAVVEHLGKYPVGLLGAEPGATRDWRVCTHVTIPMGTQGLQSGDVFGSTTYYASWEAQYAALQAFGTWVDGTWPPAPGDTAIRYIAANTPGTALRHITIGSLNDQTDVFSMLWMANQAHEAAGRATIPGADLAIARLLTSSTWSHGVANLFRTRPGVSLKTSRDLPSWVPTTVGAAALVPLTNTTDSIWTETPAMGGSRGANEQHDFSGGSYNRYFRRWGLHVAHGGGHSSTNHNGIQGVDFNTLAWVQVEAPTVLPAYSDYEDRITFGVPPESFADTAANPREVAPGVPGSAHTYDTMVTLPPPLAADPRGALLRGYSGAVGASASRSTGWSHAYRFTSGEWSRWSANNKSEAQPGGSFVLDHTRARGWPIMAGNNLNGYINLATKTWTNTSDVLSANAYPDLFQGAYVEDRDVVVFARQGTTGDTAGPIAINYQQAGATVPTRVAATLSAALSTDGNYAQASLIYVPELRRLIWYSFDGSPDTYQEIEVPATLTDTWTVTTRSITGTLPSTFSPAPSPWIYKRLDYAPQLKCLVWLTGHSSSQFNAGGRVWALRIVA